MVITNVFVVLTAFATVLYLNRNDVIKRFEHGWSGLMEEGRAEVDQTKVLLLAGLVLTGAIISKAIYKRYQKER